MYRDKYIFNVITSTPCIILSVFHELKPSYFTTKNAHGRKDRD